MFKFQLGIPQIIMIALIISSIVISIVNHGKKREPYNAYSVLIGAVLEVALLYWGGFFG
jgi:hypothetical protein